MRLPTTEDELLALIARETAKMSYPGSMSRYPNPIVSGGTKEILEDYFVYNFPILDVWSWKFDNQKEFDGWHTVIVKRIAHCIKENVEGDNKEKSVAAINRGDKVYH